MSMLDDMMCIAGDLANYDGAQHSAHGQLTEPSNYIEIEKDLTLLGFAGLEDPPRGEVPLAVRDCQLAGIRVGVHLSCVYRNRRCWLMVCCCSGGGRQLKPKQNS